MPSITTTPTSDPLPAARRQTARLLLAAIVALPGIGQAAGPVTATLHPVVATSRLPAVPMAAPPQATAPQAVPQPVAQDPSAPVRFLLAAAKETVVSAGSGGRLDRVAVELGQPVKAGQLLASFDCAELRARRGAAQAELEAARVQFEAKVKLQGLKSTSEVEVELAAANANKAEEQVRVAEAQVSQCSFRAPFAGHVARVHVKVGQGVNPGAPLVELVGHGPLKVKMNVPSSWLAWLKPGTALQGRIDETGSEAALTVTRIAGRVDAVSQTVEVEAALGDAARAALPGMSGQLKPPAITVARGS